MIFECPEYSSRRRAGAAISGSAGVRLDPGVVPFRKATECKIHVSGGEFNVAANLANCFGIPTGIASAMVDYPIGDLIAERVRAMGVQPFYKRFEHNGVTGPNMATVYSDRGYGVRPPVVFYNRANEAGAMLKPGDFDWKAIFAGGVRWFHSGGIFAALSPTTGDLIVEAMQAAKAAGAVVSFDLNFREKLWNVWGGADRASGRCCAASFQNVDVLVGNEEDLQQALGIGRTSQRAVKTLPAIEDRGHQPARGAFGQPAHLERDGLDRTAEPTPRRNANWMSTIAWAAEMDSRPDSFTGCWRANLPRMLSSWAGRTARW